MIRGDTKNESLILTEIFIALASVLLGLLLSTLYEKYKNKNAALRVADYSAREKTFLERYALCCAGWGVKE